MKAKVVWMFKSFGKRWPTVWGVGKGGGAISDKYGQMVIAGFKQG